MLVLLIVIKCMLLIRTVNTVATLIITLVVAMPVGLTCLIVIDILVILVVRTYGSSLLLATTILGFYRRPSWYLLC